jgi:transcriptional regulator with XRE-family HTH domain
MEWMEKGKSRLAEYLGAILEERRLSQRALAMYVGVSSSTISRIMSGEDADPETLRKLADYLNVPSQLLFEMAGYIETGEDLKARAVQEAEHLLRQLPPDAQRKMLEMIRLEHKYYTEQQTTEQQAQEEEEAE